MAPTDHQDFTLKRENEGLEKPIFSRRAKDKEASLLWMVYVKVVTVRPYFSAQRNPTSTGLSHTKRAGSRASKGSKN